MDSSYAPDSPSVSRRQLLNFMTGAAIASTAGAALYPVIQYFIPPAERTLNGAIEAKDQNGTPIPASQILKEVPGTRALVAGLAGEPTYITVLDNNTLDSKGLVDICTHLGCTFPWNSRDHQFQCPCHGSRYDPEGSVVRGPADRPLKLVKVEVDGDRIWISPWTALDPRTGKTPWWVSKTSPQQADIQETLRGHMITFSDQLTVATLQLSPEDIQQAAQAGFKSVLNLRSPDEGGVLGHESQLVRAAGLQYANIPVNPAQLTDSLTNEILERIDRLAKPILIHCASGIRSGALAMIYIAVNQDMTADQVFKKSQQLGLNLGESPKIQNFVQNYISDHGPIHPKA